MDPTPGEAELDPSRPIGPQIHGLNRTDPRKVAGEDLLAELWLQGATQAELSNRQRIAPELLSRALGRGCARKPFNPARPYWPQIRSRELDDPIRVAAEMAITIEVQSSGADPAKVARRHQTNDRTVAEILRRHSVNVLAAAAGRSSPRRNP
jgi:hypothetical protein